MSFWMINRKIIKIYNLMMINIQTVRMMMMKSKKMIKKIKFLHKIKLNKIILQ